MTETADATSAHHLPCEWGRVALVTVLGALVFGIDLAIPLGVAAAVPYVMVVLASVVLKRRRHILLIAAVCTGLTVVGTLLSSPGGEWWDVVINRGLAILAIWVVAFISNRYQQTSKAVREREERFRRAIVDAPVPIMIHAEDGQVLQISKTWTHITGYTPEEIPTIADWTKRAYRERKQIVRAVIDDLYGTDEKIKEDTQVVVTKSGKERLWAFSSSPLGRLSDGRRLVISMAKDVTDHKQVTEELQKAHTELEQRIEQRTADLAIANRRLRQENTDRQRAETTLRSVVEGTSSVVGSDFFASLVRHLAGALGVRYALVVEHLDQPATRARTLATWIGSAHGENLEYDLAGTPCDETSRGVLCFYPRDVLEHFPQDRMLVDLGAQSYCGAPLTTATGRIIGHLAVMDDKPMVQDIHEMSMIKIFAARATAELSRQRAEEALRSNEARMRAILDNALDAVIGMDLDGAITDWNPRAEVIFGWTKQQAIGRKMSEMIIPPEYREAHESGLQKFRATGHGPIFNHRIEITALARDGKRLPIEMTITPLKMGPTYRFNAFISDITQRKRSQEQARQHQVELAHVTRLSTMGEMVSGIAHEIHQPLTAISNYVQVCMHELRRGGWDKPQLIDTMERASDQCHRVAQIIRRLRDFTSKRQLHCSDVNVNHVIHNVVEWVAADARAHEITLRLDLQEQIPPVNADSILIEQVILNLARNSLEAMQGDRDAPRELTICSSQPDRYTVKVSLRDTGPGLPGTTAGHAFKPFFTTKSHGMGMGLSISRTIVEAHNGRLIATNNPDRGATFEFTLPAMPDPCRGSMNHARSNAEPTAHQAVPGMNEANLTAAIKSEPT